MIQHAFSWYYQSQNSRKMGSKRVAKHGFSFEKSMTGRDFLAIFTPFKMLNI